MNNQELMKIKSDIKLDLIDYYDLMKNTVDVKAQTLLMKKNKSLDVTVSNDSDLMRIYDYLIQRIESIFDICCDNVNTYFESIENFENSYEYDKKEIKKKSINEYCIFLSNDLLNFEYKDINPIGMLIVCDWYLDENQINYIKIKFGDYSSISKLQFSLDENVFNLHYGFENLDKFQIDQDFTFPNVFQFKKSKLLIELSKVEVYTLKLEEICYLDRILQNPFKNLIKLKELELFFDREKMLLPKINILNSILSLKLKIPVKYTN